jgi:hypothetical protein
MLQIFYSYAYFLLHSPERSKLSFLAEILQRKANLLNCTMSSVITHDTLSRFETIPNKTPAAIPPGSLV